MFERLERILWKRTTVYSRCIPWTSNSSDRDHFSMRIFDRRSSIRGEEKEEIMIILRQARRMSKLINEMLMIARGEMSESYDMEEVDLILLTEVIVEEIARAGREKEDSDICFQWSRCKDDGKSYIIITNDDESCSECDQLWKGTWSYWYSMERTRRYDHRRSKDDGIGIDQEDIPKIWDRFYRVDKAVLGRMEELDLVFRWFTLSWQFMAGKYMWKARMEKEQVLYFSFQKMWKYGCPVFLYSIISLLFAISNGKIKNIVKKWYT